MSQQANDQWQADHYDYEGDQKQKMSAAFLALLASLLVTECLATLLGPDKKPPVPMGTMFFQPAPFPFSRLIISSRNEAPIQAIIITKRDNGQPPGAVQAFM